jgi:hypothetical protein
MREVHGLICYCRAVSVTPSNDPPFSVPLNFSTMENEFLMIRLRGVDVDGDSLTMIIQSLPSFGTLYQVTKLSIETKKIILYVSNL